MSERILHDGVEFRQIPGFDGYAVSACGTVASCRTHGGNLGEWHELFPSTNRDGYQYFTLRNGGVRRGKTVKVHRLVLELWLGPCPEGHECRHLNGNPADNCLENLVWGTHSENLADKVRHGTGAKGSRVGGAKLTEVDIPIIRGLLDRGKTLRAIAEQFGVSYSAIGQISSRKTWAHI